MVDLLTAYGHAELANLAASRAHEILAADPVEAHGLATRRVVDRMYEDAKAHALVTLALVAVDWSTR